jgi:flagellar basal body-associated protein FliL
MDILIIIIVMVLVLIVAYISIAILLVCMGMNARYKEDGKIIKAKKEQEKLNDSNNGRDKDKQISDTDNIVHNN